MDHCEDFILNRYTQLQMMKESSKAILYAADLLKRDMKNVFSDSHYLSSSESFIKVCIQETHFMQPETFTIDFSIENTLCITGADELGTIYGLLYVSSEYLGVDPLYFFADKQSKKEEFVSIPKESYESKPFYVKFRGWFINDEVLLTGWNEKCPENKVWENVFEILLRLGGNMVIPGTDLNSRKLRKLATDMGLWITHHHAEPLGAEMFLRTYPDKEASYDVNGSLFDKLWEEAVVDQKDLKVIWNIGFRGQGDKAFWDNDPKYDTAEKRGALISRIMQKQYDIIHSHIKEPVICTNLYGEIMELYKDGFIEFPKDTIKIWADSGYGKMVSRRQENHNPRIYALPETKDIGPHGIYYHVTFYDLQASNHLTMLPNSPDFVCQELTNAFQKKANVYLVVNCGNIRPHIYMLDLVKELWCNGTIDVQSHRQKFTKRLFEESHEVVATCIEEYFKATINYGPHQDEKAGEQFYHYISRNIISSWMKGETKQTCEKLIWVTGKTAFYEQVEWFNNQCEEGIDAWIKLKEQCLVSMKVMTQDENQLFSDMILTQVILHLSGCQGAIYLCRSFKLFKQKEYAAAFVYASKAMNSFKEGLEAIQNAEHGKWACFYENDCLTNVKLTVYCLDGLRRYLRMLGDSPNFYDWEKEYLYQSSEKNVVLITNMTNHLEDDELALQLEKKFVNF